MSDENSIMKARLLEKNQFIGDLVRDHNAIVNREMLRELSQETRHMGTYLGTSQRRTIDDEGEKTVREEQEKLVS